MTDDRNVEQGNAPSPKEASSAAVQPGPFSAVPPEGAERMRHSGIGIASTVLGIIAVILSVVAFSMAAADALRIADEINPEAILTEEEAAELMTRYSGLIGGVLLFIVTGFLFLIGAVLGIIGLFAHNRKKLFPILGTILNAAPIALIIVLMAVGAFIG
jgi:hypothetical protein